MGGVTRIFGGSAAIEIAVTDTPVAIADIAGASGVSSDQYFYQPKQWIAAHVNLGANLVRYSRFGDRYTLKTDDRGRQYYGLENKGVRSWENLGEMMEDFLSSPENRGKNLNFDVKLYELDRLAPTKATQEKFIQLSKKYPQQTLSIVVEGDPIDPPVIYSFKNGVLTLLDVQVLENTASKITSAAARVWQATPIQEKVEAYFADPKNEAQKKLFDAIKKVDAGRAHKEANLGVFLAEVVRVYNEAFPQNSIPLDKRTQVLVRVESLVADLRRLALDATKDSKLNFSSLFYYFEPVSAVLRKHPPNRAIDNHALSIGGGAMVAQFEYARTLMDLGHLPLDFRLTAIQRNKPDGSRPVVWEVNNRGTSRASFDDIPLNPGDRKRIYYVTGDERNDYLKRYGAKIIFLNVKAKDMRALFEEEEFLKILAELRPAMPMPTKAYDANGKIPYLEAYRYLMQKGYARLARRLVVEGGYFSAPDILRRKGVSMTFASASDTALGLMNKIFVPGEMRGNTTDRWQLMNGDFEFIENAEMAAYIMASGANKNFLTYYLGRVFMQNILEDALPDRGRYDLDLDKAREENIQMNEEIVARLMPHYYASDVAKGQVYRFWTPNGPRVDIKKCAPDNVEGLIAIKDQMEYIFGLEPEDRVLYFQQLTSQIAGGKIMVNGEKARVASAQGTRNARDGYIDAVIEYAYTRLVLNGDMAPDTNYVSFYDNLYPNQWKGDHAQEGRNGYAPLHDMIGRENITFPPEFYEIVRLYQNADSTHLGYEAERGGNSVVVFPSASDLTHLALGWNVPPRLIPADYNPNDLHIDWGYPNPWLAALRADFETLAKNIKKFRYKETITLSFFYNGLGILEARLKPIFDETGLYPELNRRMMDVKARIASLRGAFKERMDSNRYLTEDQCGRVCANFKDIVSIWLAILDGEQLSTTNLADRVRRSSQDLFAIKATLAPQILNTHGLSDGYPQVERKALPPPPVLRLSTQAVASERAAVARQEVTPAKEAPQAMHVHFSETSSHVVRGAEVVDPHLAVVDASDAMVMSAAYLVNEGGPLRIVAPDTLEIETDDEVVAANNNYYYDQPEPALPNNVLQYPVSPWSNFSPVALPGILGVGAYGVPFASGFVQSFALR